MKPRKCVLAIAYKTETGTTKLQQRLVEYNHQLELKEMREGMKEGVEFINGKFLAMSHINIE